MRETPNDFDIRSSFLERIAFSFQIALNVRKMFLMTVRHSVKIIGFYIISILRYNVALLPPI